MQDKVCVESQEELGQGVAWTCDVSNTEQVESAFNNIEVTLGAVDVLINDAASINLKPLAEYTLNEIQANLTTRSRDTDCECTTLAQVRAGRGRQGGTRTAKSGRSQPSPEGTHATG